MSNTKQKAIVHSSVVAKCMAAKEATEGLWLRSIFQKMGVFQAKPMCIFGDS